MILLLFSTAMLGGCAYLGYLKDPFVDIPNFREVNSSLYRGGEPDERGWKRLAGLGVKTAVSLRGARQDDPAQRSAQALGIRTIHIPMSVYEKPSDETVLAFIEAVGTRTNLPVFVYCDSGRDRTGAMIALYRVVFDGWTIKQAYREARQLGFFPYHGREAPLKMFIHQLKDKQVYFEKAREYTAQ